MFVASSNEINKLFVSFFNVQDQTSIKEAIILKRNKFWLRSKYNLLRHVLQDMINVFILYQCNCSLEVWSHIYL